MERPSRTRVFVAIVVVGVVVDAIANPVGYTLVYGMFVDTNTISRKRYKLENWFCILALSQFASVWQFETE
jgi:hypothetical protein